MHLNKSHSTENKEKSKSLGLELHFKVILKFWKKESVHSDVTIPSKLCQSENEFVDAINQHFGLESAHCLEEIWVMQQGNSYEKVLPWIKHKGGRIKIDIPLEYKEYLLKRASEGGSRLFEDPLY